MFRLARRFEARRWPPLPVAMMLVAASLCAGVAHADNGVAVRIFNNPLSPNCKTAHYPKRTVDNQYLLLLFFLPGSSKDVHMLFQTTPDAGGKPQDGCWIDKEGDPKKSIKPGAVLRVQGSCPTDCTRPSDAELLDARAHRRILKGGQHSQYPGDPLRGPKDSLGWGLFFSDPSGKGGDYSDDDDQTKFLVWQIVVGDSRQAGRVLNDLYNQAPFKNGAFIGHILIGYTPPHKS